MDNKFLSTNSNSLISQLWDQNVEVRAVDLESGSDYTYNNVILPWVIEQMRSVSQFSESVLDIGSGCGFLTNAIYSSGWNRIVGIDISGRSIEYSRKRYSHIEFIHEDIYKLPEEMHFDVCVAVMAVNNMPNAKLFFKKVSKYLNKSGKIILVLPHPRFWPIKHIDDSDFCYDIEAVYCKKFNTKGRDDYESRVLFYHRSTERYLSLLNTYGFAVIKCEDIFEKEDDSFPDILGIVAIKE